MAVFHNHYHFSSITMSLLSHLTDIRASAGFNLMLKSNDVLTPVKNNWHVRLCSRSPASVSKPLSSFPFPFSTCSVWLWHRELETQVRVIFISHVVWLKAGGSLLKAAGWETVGRPVKDTVKLIQGKLTLKWSSEDLERVEQGRERRCVPPPVTSCLDFWDGLGVSATAGC